MSSDLKLFDNADDAVIANNYDACIFDIAYWGACGRKITKGTEFCHEHLRAACCVCGGQAIHSCAANVGSFTCGYPLCKLCVHKHS